MLDYGPWGVSVFFVLSGFLMTYAYYEKCLTATFKESISFSLNKIKKLYPLHLVTMIFSVVLVIKSLINEISLKNVLLFGGQIFLNVTLTQSWVPISLAYFSLNGVAWYLSVCLFLYAVFPTMINKIKKSSLQKVIFWAIAIYVSQVVIGTVSQFVNLSDFHIDNFSKWLVYICPIFRMGDFFIGCCAGCIYLKGRGGFNKICASVCEILIFCAIIGAEYIYLNQIGFLGAEYFRYGMLFTPFSVMLIYLFAIKKGIISRILTCKPLIYIGNISAYTFLIHQIVIRYMELIIGKFFREDLNKYIFTILAIIITIICTELYKKVEDLIKNHGYGRSIV